MTTTKQKDSHKKYSIPTSVVVFVVMYLLCSLIGAEWIAILSISIGIVGGWIWERLSDKKGCCIKRKANRGGTDR